MCHEYEADRLDPSCSSMCWSGSSSLASPGEDELRLSMTPCPLRARGVNLKPSTIHISNLVDFVSHRIAVVLMTARLAETEPEP